MANINFRRLLVILGSTTLMIGCEFHAGSVSVAKAQVEEQTQKMVAQAVGEATAPKITCPGDLKGEVGTVMVCTMPVDDKLADVTLTVTAVEGTNVKWNFKTSPHK